MIIKRLRNAFGLMCSRNGRQAMRYAVAKRFINPILRRIGYTLIADYFYQPIPNDSDLLASRNKERPLSSVVGDVDCQIAFAENLLRKYRGEFNDAETLEQCGYREASSGLIDGDAQFLYSMVREYKPEKIIEIGAGGSTHIIAAALKKTFSETKQKTDFCSIDPYPMPSLEGLCQASDAFTEFQLLKKHVQDVDISLFESLKENDILFVDSSHVFKQGSDVEFEFLRIYPLLRRGVIVHIHDIFFPFDYPYEWNAKEFWFWNEQYFLEAFLQFNDKFKILASLSLVLYRKSEVFSHTINSFCLPAKVGSFWMKSIR